MLRCRSIKIFSGWGAGLIEIKANSDSQLELGKNILYQELHNYITKNKLELDAEKVESCKPDIVNKLNQTNLGELMSL